MHHIITDDVEYAIPAKEVDVVFKLIEHLQERNIKFTHHFEE